MRQIRDDIEERVSKLIRAEISKEEGA